MSDKNNKPDAENPDQALIREVYGSLHKPHSPKALDDRILAAAHSAVEPQEDVDEKLKMDKTPAIKRRPAWLTPLSAAAMLMLVTTLSLHQIFDPAAPLDAQSYVQEAMMPQEKAMPAPVAKLKAKPRPKQEKKLRPAPLPEAASLNEMAGSDSAFVTEDADAVEIAQVKSVESKKAQLAYAARAKLQARNKSMAKAKKKMAVKESFALSDSIAFNSSPALQAAPESLALTQEEAFTFEADSNVAEGIKAESIELEGSQSSQRDTVLMQAETSKKEEARISAEVLSVQAFNALQAGDGAWVYQFEDERSFWLKYSPQHRVYRLEKRIYQLEGTVDTERLKGDEVQPGLIGKP